MLASRSVVITSEGVEYSFATAPPDDLTLHDFTHMLYSDAATRMDILLIHVKSASISAVQQKANYRRIASSERKTLRLVDVTTEAPLLVPRSKSTLLATSSVFRLTQDGGDGDGIPFAKKMAWLLFGIQSTLRVSYDSLEEQFLRLSRNLEESQTKVLLELEAQQPMILQSIGSTSAGATVLGHCITADVLSNTLKTARDELEQVAQKRDELSDFVEKEPNLLEDDLQKRAESFLRAADLGSMTSSQVMTSQRQQQQRELLSRHVASMLKYYVQVMGKYSLAINKIYEAERRFVRAKDEYLDAVDYFSKNHVSLVEKFAALHQRRAAFHCAVEKLLTPLQSEYLAICDETRMFNAPLMHMQSFLNLAFPGVVAAPREACRPDDDPLFRRFPAHSEEIDALGKSLADTAVTSHECFTALECTLETAKDEIARLWALIDEREANAREANNDLSLKVQSLQGEVEMLKLTLEKCPLHQVEEKFLADLCAPETLAVLTRRRSWDDDRGHTHPLCTNDGVFSLLCFPYILRADACGPHLPVVIGWEKFGKDFLRTPDKMLSGCQSVLLGKVLPFHLDHDDEYFPIICADVSTCFDDHRTVFFPLHELPVRATLSRESRSAVEKVQSSAAQSHPVNVEVIVVKSVKFQMEPTPMVNIVVVGSVKM